MESRNEYRVIRDVAWDKGTLTPKADDAIILERTEEGIVYFWSLFPQQRKDNRLLSQNQDLDDYLVDGAWLVPEPWMYFDRLDDIIPLINRQCLHLNCLELGALHSIREARAKALVMLGLME